MAPVPDACGVYGWMWITPSPWVWIPSTDSNSGTLGMKWSQMYTLKEECQWSWLIRGGTLAACWPLLSSWLRLKATRNSAEGADDGRAWRTSPWALDARGAATAGPRGARHLLLRRSSAHGALRVDDPLPAATSPARGQRPCGRRPCGPRGWRCAPASPAATTGRSMRSHRPAGAPPEAQQRAVVGDDHAVGRGRPRRPLEVGHPAGRLVGDAPPGTAEPPAQVDVLHEHEVRLVESPDLVQGAAAHGEARARHPVDGTGLLRPRCAGSAGSTGCRS